MKMHKPFGVRLGIADYSSSQGSMQFLKKPFTFLLFTIVLHGYEPKSSYPYLSLKFGEVVHILEENGGWYRGFALLDKHTKGIFPASHISIKDCEVINPG